MSSIKAHPEVDTRDAQIESCADISRIQLQRSIVVAERFLRLAAVRHRSTDAVVQEPILEGLFSIHSLLSQ